jgi:hypothetical protein
MNRFTKMSFNDLVRVDIRSLRNRVEVQAYFTEISERRRKLKIQLAQYDEIIRNLQVVLTRV